MQDLEGEEPVSPTSQYHSTPAFNLSILVVFETDIPIDSSSLWTVLEKAFLPINPRFSSIMTVNDVISGTIFYGIHLYLQRSGARGAGEKRMTALVLANTRAVKSYRTVGEMVRPDAEARWGNQFGVLHVPIPRCKDVKAANPVEFVFHAKKAIEKGRNSLGLYLTGKLLQAIAWLRGPEAAARYIAAAARNTTLSVSNVVGPMEQMLIADHPVTNFYFMSTGVPQSLNITVVSYAGKLRLAMATEKSFINSELFAACLEEAFSRIFEAAVGVGPQVKEM